MTHGISLIERLEAYDHSRPSTVISARGTRTVHTLVNPDGPEAAALIRELVEALETLLEYAAGFDREGLPVFEQSTAALLRAKASHDQD